MVPKPDSAPSKESDFCIFSFYIWAVPSAADDIVETQFSLYTCNIAEHMIPPSGGITGPSAVCQEWKRATANRDDPRGEDPNCNLPWECFESRSSIRQSYIHERMWGLTVSFLESCLDWGTYLSVTLSNHDILKDDLLELP